MHSVIIAVLSLFYGSALCETVDKQALMRDLIIILDDRQEDNPSKAGFTIDHVSHALMAETAPLLVSATLWRTFVDLRQEWLLLSQVQGSYEYNVAHWLDDVNDAINYWYKILHDTVDESHIKSIIADKINEQFFTQEQYDALSKAGKLPYGNGFLLSCARFASKCNLNAWYWFYLDEGYYLAIPKTYANRYTQSLKPKDILNAAGFSSKLVDSLADPLYIDPIRFMQLKPIENTILPTLKKLFASTKKYTWSFFIAGHGQAYKSAYGKVKTIAGITIETFKQMCCFLNDSMSVHLLWITSCFVGGMHRLELAEKKHHYAIVVESLGDVPCYASLNLPHINDKSLFHCKKEFIRKSLDGRWELWYQYSKQFINFFEKVHTLHNDNKNKNKDLQDVVYEIFSEISPRRFIENSPHILPAHSNRWLLCYPSDWAYLSIQAGLLADMCSMPHTLHTHTVLIDAPVLKSGFNIVPNSIKFIVVITPGESAHYIGPVNAVNVGINDFMNYFWPAFEQICGKQILFESITCQCDPKDPMTQMLGITENTVTFSNVLMRIVKNEQIELIFTVANGDVFYATMRSIDGKPMFRNLQKLSSKAVESYRSYYEKTKTELITQYDQSTATLRNHYLQAMATAKAQAPTAQAHSAASSVVSAAA